MTKNEATNKAEDLKIADSLHKQAKQYENQGKYQEAEDSYKKALQIYELLGVKLQEAAILYKLAYIYDDQRRYEKAEGLYKKSLKICEELLGAKHPDTATVLDGLARMYDNQGKYEEAEGLYKRSLEITEEVLKAEHPDTATTLNNLALLYCRQGRYEEAEGLSKRAIEIYKLLGSRHPYMATGLHNLALIYYKQKKYQEAEELYQRALGIREEMLGMNHPDTITTLYNLAIVNIRLDRVEKAEQLCEKTLELSEEVLGANHPDTVTVFKNLVLIYKKQGKYEKVKALYITKKQVGHKEAEANVLLDSDGLEDKNNDARIRKEINEKILAAKNIPVNKMLPSIKSEAEVTIRPLKEIARRAMVLCLVATKAEGIEQKKILNILKDNRLMDALTPKERSFFYDSKPDNYDRIRFTWRYESCWVLLWALGYIDELGIPTDTCDVAKAIGFMSGRSGQQFIDKARPKCKKEILDMADLIYRYHWVVRDAYINKKEIPGNLNRDVVTERHYALNWLIGHMDQEWDDISTDT